MKYRRPCVVPSTHLALWSACQGVGGTPCRPCGRLPCHCVVCLYLSYRALCLTKASHCSLLWCPTCRSSGGATMAPVVYSLIPCLIVEIFSNCHHLWLAVEDCRCLCLMLMRRSSHSSPHPVQLWHSCVFLLSMTLHARLPPTAHGMRCSCCTGFGQVVC